MDNGQAMGSRPSDPRAAAEGVGNDLDYRGERLGLPQEGPGSAASLGRRLAAICVDWGLSALIAYGLIADGSVTATNNWTLVVFTLMAMSTVGTVGMTPGKRLLGVRLVHLSGQRLTFPRAVLRTALLALAIPALIWDRDGRGLHDRAVGSVQVRLGGTVAARPPEAAA
ncbi:RDD family protein [Streptomyces profundus]|uniref:RDD family protein n=1 Tax=Streptomyces profundus TaxID=2867410 RepID=UPI001D16BDA1|nr:RDD family protein [Streptomyces sp. MA3_2.13]UED83761.1 RDD family protein [Streptomyces sp. MA3_2.13]